MGIEYYTGTDGRPTINVTSRAELMEALDLLHTQVMDNIGEDDAEALNALEQAMDLLHEAMIDDEGDDA